MDPFNIIVYLFVLVIGLGLGVTVTLNDLRVASEQLPAFAVGMGCQFVFMPFLAFALCSAFQLGDDVALGIILVGSCPGGSTSNLFCYWCGGRVALSVAMSAFSTCASFGLLPFNIYLYGKLAYGSSADVPFASLAFTLLLVVLPFGIGLWFRHNNTVGQWRGMPYWRILEKVMNVCGGIFLVLAIAVGLARDAEQILDMSAGEFVVPAIMEPIGAAIGFGLAAAAKLPMMDRTTIALETGIQNSIIAIAIAQTSYDGDQRDRVLRGPLTYSLFYSVHSLWLTLLFRHLNRQAIAEAEEANSEPTGVEDGNKKSTEMAKVESPGKDQAVIPNQN